MISNLLLAVVCVFCAAAGSSAELVHGLWVWKAEAVLSAPRGAQALLKFCQSERINEVYVSISPFSHEQRTVHFIDLLHRSNIRVEALLSSVDADEPGQHREKLLGSVKAIVEFNQRHPNDRFDGIHLDIEPHQRAENKGPANLRFLPDLVATYRAVRARAERVGMTVNADVPIKYLKADIRERRMLLAALPRLTLMLYEISTPQLPKTAAQAFDTAYRGLDGANLARMSIALRTTDYGNLLPTMFDKLDQTLAGNPHYLGWARHSYNDTLRLK